MHFGIAVNCKKLYGGKNVKTVKRDAFVFCYNLESIADLSSLEEIQGDAFLLSVTTEVDLPRTVKTLKREVFAAVGSDQDSVSNTHAFNFQYGRWNIIMWPYLNQFIAKGSKPWIMLDSQFNENYGGAVWNDRIKLKIKSIIDEATDANRWKGRSRFNACFNNWRFAACGGMEGGVDLTTLDL